MLSFYLCMLETPEDQIQFREIYEKYYRSMLFAARKIVHSQEQAEDAVHEAFVKLIDHFEDYKTIKPEKKLAYCLIVAKRKAIDIVRQEKHFQIKGAHSGNAEEEFAAELADESSEEPLNFLVKKEAAGLLRAVIEELPEESRLLLSLKYDQELSSKQIGELLGLSDSLVNVKIHRIKKQIREVMLQNGYVSDL